MEISLLVVTIRRSRCATLAAIDASEITGLALVAADNGGLMSKVARAPANLHRAGLQNTAKVGPSHHFLWFCAGAMQGAFDRGNDAVAIDHRSA